MKQTVQNYINLDWKERNLLVGKYINSCYSSAFASKEIAGQASRDKCKLYEIVTLYSSGE